jgi:hypothetical protein
MQAFKDPCVVFKRWRAMTLNSLWIARTTFWWNFFVVGHLRFRYAYL